MVAEDPGKTGETILTPEGETIQVDPEKVETPGYGEGSPQQTLML